ncbi:MAG: NAD-dependent epimerase/dehydratase family protein [Verrucomicrobia bacterium]|nr:NAD-dependent epimerase/dehydratase family protein [Verrucomicrobiota bacterium]
MSDSPKISARRWSMADLLTLATETAREAGDVLRAGASHLRMVRFQDATDIKLQADVESEQLIRKRLAVTAFPVIGEEEGGDSELLKGSEPYWVVDPLDGTYNYSRGNPATCVSIGLMRGDTPVLGVIYDFSSDECFAAIVTEGLLINGQRWQPLWAQDLAQASLATGFPSGMDKSPEKLQEFIQHVGSYKKIRMIGSAALALAYVAAGRFDVYFEQAIRLWDVAAGLALIQAAGGVVRMKPSATGKFLAFDVWAAGNPSLLQPMSTQPHLLILGAGFVGAALAAEAVRRGWLVTALTRNPDSLAHLSSLGVHHCICADIASHDWHDKVSSSVDFLVNCVSSGRGGLPGYEHSYLRGQESLVAFASRAHINCCIYTSSTSVYPQSDGDWIDEDAPAIPSSPSGKIILQSEEILRNNRQLFDRLFVLRLSGIYGPGRHYILDQLRRGELEFGGRGDYYLNLIHQTDIVRALCTVFDGTEGLSGGTYNLSDGQPFLKEEVVIWLARKLGLAVPVFCPDILTPRQQRRSQPTQSSPPPVPNRRISSNRIRRDIGWRPLYPSFREGYVQILSTSVQ